MLKSNFFKIVLIFSLLFSAFMPFAYATSTENINTNTASNVSTNSSTSTTVSTVSSVEDNALEFTNILNILLIAVGIVIILLAIAILIRLKK